VADAPGSVVNEVEEIREAAEVVRPPEPEPRAAFDLPLQESPHPHPLKWQYLAAGGALLVVVIISLWLMLRGGSQAAKPIQADQRPSPTIVPSSEPSPPLPSPTAQSGKAKTQASPTKRDPEDKRKHDRDEIDKALGRGKELI
jgi:hypothetical protein